MKISRWVNPLPHSGPTRRKCGRKSCFDRNTKLLRFEGYIYEHESPNGPGFPSKIVVWKLIFYLLLLIILNSLSYLKLSNFSVFLKWLEKLLCRICVEWVGLAWLISNLHHGRQFLNYVGKRLLFSFFKLGWWISRVNFMQFHKNNLISIVISPII